MRILFLSDLHCGNLLGLTPPKWQSDATSALTRPVWDWYVAKVKELGRVDIVVVNGDAVDGDGHHQTLGQLTTDTKEQAEMACAALSLVNARKRLMTFGTSYHTVGSYDYEELVAEYIDAEIRDTLLLDVNGVKLNVRHVAGRSDIPYGQGTPILKEMVRDLINAMQEEREPADWTIRGHVHYWIKVEIDGKKAVSLPALQVPETIFGRRCRAMYYTVGMAHADIDKNGHGDIVVDKMPLKLVRPKEYIRCGETARSRSRSAKS